MTIAPERIDDLDFPTPEIDEPISDELVPYKDGTLLFDPPHVPTFRILEMLEDSIRVEPIALPDPAQLYQDIVDARQAILDQPNYIQAQRVIDEQRQRYLEEDRWTARGSGPYQHYCWCSPGRGMFFDRHREAEYISSLMEWPEPITYMRWDSNPLIPEPSKELAVIQTNAT